MMDQNETPDFDLRVKSALCAVQINGDRRELAALRLKASLAALRTAELSVESDPRSMNSGETQVQSHQPAGELSQPARRKLLLQIGAGLLAVAAGWFITLGLFPGSSGISTDSLIRGGRSLVASIERGEVEWKPAAQWPMQAAYQLDTYRMQLKPTGFASLGYDPFGGTSSEASVWRMESETDERVAFWIEVESQTGVADLLESMKPLTNSGKWTVAAMQVGSQIIVLVSDGDVSDLLLSKPFALQSTERVLQVCLDPRDFLFFPSATCLSSNPPLGNTIM